MINKNIQIRLLMLIPMLSLLTNSIKAQLYPYIKENGRDKLQIVTSEPSNIISMSDARSTDLGKLAAAGALSTPFYALWLETGDGNYINSFPEGFKLNDIPVGPQKHPPLMLASKLYEQIRRPPTTRTAVTMSNQGNTPTTWNVKSPDLLPGEQLKLFPNIGNVVPGDPMVFAISYRPGSISTEGPKEYRIVFRYNASDSAAFLPVVSATSYTEIQQQATAGTISVSDIRHYNNERIIIPQSTDNELISTKGNFRNGIVFDNIMAENKTANIFISLTPVDSKSLPFYINFEAEMYYRKYEGGEWLSLGKSPLTQMNKAEAHDPNDISVYPEFLNLPQTTQTLRYTINFQNTGLGDADSVKVAFYCPPQMKFEKGKEIEDVTASYSELPAYKLWRNTDWVPDSANGRIIFTLKPTDANRNNALVTLDGTKNVANPAINPLTKGQISFTLKVQPDRNVNKQKKLHAWAEIYFRGQHASKFCISGDMVNKGVFIQDTKGYEMPVRTGDAVVVYKQCDQPPSCDCMKPKGIFKRIGCAFRALFGSPCGKKDK